MKLKALKALDNFIQPGDVFEAPEQEARAHMLLGSAELVDESHSTAAAEPSTTESQQPGAVSASSTSSGRYRRRDLRADK